MSRPTLRNPVLDEQILRCLREGRSFNWFDSDEAVGYPSTSTVRRWRAEDPGFDGECARACEAQAEADYDRMEDIERLTIGKDIRPGEAKIDPKAANVVLANMRWRMEKRKSRAFGQKVEVSATLTLEQLVAASTKPTGQEPPA